VVLDVDVKKNERAELLTEKKKRFPLRIRSRKKEKERWERPKGKDQLIQNNAHGQKKKEKGCGEKTPTSHR